MTPAEAGRELARTAPPLTEAQVEAAARILAGLDQDDELARTG